MRAIDSLFDQYIKNNKLLVEGEQVLLAVSGGIDSMVMAHLFLHTPFKVGIAHCNFGLRAAESDADQELVRSFAQQYQLPFHHIRFDTLAYAEKEGISIQMAARTLRYEWFNKLTENYGYSKVAVAHHADDAIETCFINLLRGTGIQGLTGIEVLKNSIIRPLLFLYRKDIEQYAKRHDVAFREDQSNASDQYIRNKLRHLVLPSLERINSGFRQRMSDNIAFFQQAQTFIDRQMAQIETVISRKQGDQLLISIEELKKLDTPAFCLFHLLQAYGFKNESIDNIIKSLDSTSGKLFASATHQLLKDRSDLIVAPLAVDNAEQHRLYENDTFVHHDMIIRLRPYLRPADYLPLRSPLVAQLDYHKLQFPLVLRHWKPGDKFIPLGMQGMKKLSDFFIDEKLSLHDKNRQWLLYSQDRLVWVLGRRIDDRFKVSNSTDTILEVRIEDALSRG